MGAQVATKAVKRKMPPLVLPDAAGQGSGSASNRQAPGMAGRKRSASDADTLTARQLQGAVSARDMQQQLVPWLKSHQQKDQRLQHALAVATPTDPLGKVISRCAAAVQLWPLALSFGAGTGAHVTCGKRCHGSHVTWCYCRVATANGGVEVTSTKRPDWCPPGEPP